MPELDRVEFLSGSVGSDPGGAARCGGRVQLACRWPQKDHEAFDEWNSHPKRWPYSFVLGGGCRRPAEPDLRRFTTRAAKLRPRVLAGVQGLRLGPRCHSARGGGGQQDWTMPSWKHGRMEDGHRWLVFLIRLVFRVLFECEFLGGV